MNEAQCARTMQIIDAHGRDPAALIAILQDAHAENSYLSQENLELIAKELNVAISKVYGVATFFKNFSLEAKGKHLVKVCNGTACHVFRHLRMAKLCEACGVLFGKLRDLSKLRLVKKPLSMIR